MRFFKNYHKLYSSVNDPKLTDIQLFLNKLNRQSLTKEQADYIDMPLTLSELHRSLLKIPNNKAPGPDGFPAEFLKHFWDILSPLFNRMIGEIKSKGKIPSHMNLALIRLLKPDNDPTLPSGYPLSLINTDIKIISKALAFRLDSVISSIIHKDQTGFIKCSHSSSNFRRLFNIIDVSQLNQIQAIIVSLDAEKAFDKVNWTFLFAVLGKFGFGDSFIQWDKDYL